MVTFQDALVQTWRSIYNMAYGFNTVVVLTGKQAEDIHEVVMLSPTNATIDLGDQDQVDRYGSIVLLSSTSFFPQPQAGVVIFDSESNADLFMGMIADKARQLKDLYPLEFDSIA